MSYPKRPAASPLEVDRSRSFTYVGGLLLRRVARGTVGVRAARSPRAKAVMTRAAVFLVVLSFACSEQDSPPIAGFDTADGGCFMTGCFDNDPCTDDLCLESGECLFVPMDAGNACLDDRHCDTGTGNACEIGRCMVNACNLKRCTFELVPDCRPCGTFFGTCDGGDPCNTSICDEVSMTCGPSSRFAECDSRCSRTARDPHEALTFWPGFEGPFAGTITPAALTCERDCECEVAMLLANDSSTDGPRLVTAETHVPLTCRISTCDGPQTVDCGDFVHGRQYIVYGQTLNLGTAKDRAPAPPGSADTAEPFQQSDTLSVMVACPLLSSMLPSSFGSWLATLEYQGQVAALDFDSGPNISSHAFAVDCQGCEAMPLEGLERAALLITAEWPRVRILLSWDSGYAEGDLYPNAMKLVSELKTPDDVPFGHLTLEPVP